MIINPESTSCEAHSMMALLLPAGTGRAAGRAAVTRPHRPMAAVGVVARVGALSSDGGDSLPIFRFQFQGQIC